MPPESTTPPPPPSGNMKYLIIGLLFLGAAGALWLIARPEPPPPAPPPPPEEVSRVNPLGEAELELEPEPEQPDAGPAPEPEPEEKPRRAAPKRGTWECSGDLAGAAKVVNAHRTQVRNCYERRLKVNNLLQGDLRLKIKVNASGRVVQTAVSGSLRDNDVFRCVRAIAESWSFDAPTGGNCAVVDVPFSFSPKQ